MSEKTSKYLTDFDGADIIFDINGTKIYASKACLSLSSPVFKTMFTADFKEQNCQEIMLPGKDVGSFVYFMKLLHPPCILDNLKLEYVRCIIQLSEEYQIIGLKQKCEEILLKDASSLMDYEFSVKYNLNKLRKKILNEIKAEPAEKLRNYHNFLDSFANGFEKDLVTSFLQKCIQYEQKIENYEKSLTATLNCQGNTISKYSLDTKAGKFIFSGNFMDILRSEKHLESPHFELYDINWFVTLRINGGYLGIYLNIKSDKRFTASYKISILHNDPELSYEYSEVTKDFNVPVKSWGYPEFITLNKLLCSQKPFLNEGQITVCILLKTI